MENNKEDKKMNDNSKKTDKNKSVQTENKVEEKQLKKVEKMEKRKVRKEKVGESFIRTIKQRWLITRTNTMLLIAILIAIVILINSIVQSLDLTAIDCTTSKIYTLTDESKERVSSIENSVNIYFVGYDDSDTSYTLAKQYNDANSNINVKIVDVSENLDFASQYDVSSDDEVIIVESGESTVTLDYYDLYTYDSDYNTVDITEQKLTSAILNVTSDYVPTVYFLAGYTSLGFDYSSGLYYLSQYLDDEVLEYSTLNILTTGYIPDDCDTLVIMTPESDFDDITTDTIINYINEGGNILWLQSAVIDDSVDYTNVNKILALYGIDSFDVGYIYETDSDYKVLSESGLYYLTDIQSTTVTDGIDNVAFLQSTKINIDEDSLEDLNVEETDLILTSDTAYFTSDISGTGSGESEQGSFVIGAEFVKTVSEEEDEEENDTDEEETTEEDTDMDEETEETEETEEDESDEETEEDEEDAITSTLIIYGDNYFIADYPIQYGSYYVYLIDSNGFHNKDLMLNSIAYLTDNYEDITIRKSYSDSTTTFTATESQNILIARIIFMVPIAIILLGFIVWQVRRNKK